MSIMAFL